MGNVFCRKRQSEIFSQNTEKLYGAWLDKKQFAYVALQSRVRDRADNFEVCWMVVGLLLQQWRSTLTRFPWGRTWPARCRECITLLWNLTFLYWLLQQYCCCTVKQEPFHFTTLHSFSNLELIFPDLTSSWIKIQDCLREKGHMKFEVTEIYLNIIFEFSHQYELSLSIMTICLSTYCSYYFGYCNVALVLLKMFSFRFQQDEFSFYLCLSDEFFSWVSSSSRDFGIRVEKSNLWNSPSSLLLCSLPQVHFIVYVIP